MRRLMQGIAVLTMLFGSVWQAAAAPSTPKVFTAAGYFEEGKLSGTVTIDTANGIVLSSDLIITVSTGEEFDFSSLPSVHSSKPDSATSLTFVSGGNEMILWLPVSTLVGYEGGSIIAAEPRYHITSIWYSSNEGEYDSGFTLEFGTLELE
jgi:hypothetical protein